MAIAPAREQLQLRPFTDFQSVTPFTPVKDLNFNWRERDLPQGERTKHVHGLHPYLGKFVPQLVEVFLRKYRPSRVLDPFCGSGTTMVEATALGIESVGTDISGFNCLLASVKTRKYDLPLLHGEVSQALDLTLNTSQRRLLETREAYGPNSYLEQWYAPEALAILREYRSHMAGNTYEDVLKVILSRAARSARQTAHFDLDFPKKPQTEPYYCYKHSRTCQPTSDARGFLKRYSADTFKRIEAFANVRTDVETQVVRADARRHPYPGCDLVVTSPPYVGLIDYHEQHRYAYELLGIEDHSADEIGPASAGSSLRARAEYVNQITAVFQNVVRSLPRNGRLVVVVHDRRQLYAEIADRLGVETEYEIHRHVDRRTGRRANEFFESIFVWRAT